MKNKMIGAISSSVLYMALQSTAAAETLKDLFDSACLAHGIDQEQCLCILGEVTDNHSPDAALYLALDMNLRYDEAASLLDEIGEDAAFAAGDTFDRAQNLQCSATRLAQLEGTYQGASSGGAVAVASAVEGAEEETLIDVVKAPLSVLTAPHPLLDMRAIQGDVTILASAVIQSELLQASAGGNIENHFTVYEVANTNGDIDTNGDGVGDVRPDDPTYAALAQARALSPKLTIPATAGTDQVLGQMVLEGGKLYAPLVRFKHEASPATEMSALGALTNPASVEDLMQSLNQPRHLHFAVPLDALQLANAISFVSEDTIAVDVLDHDADGTVTSHDMLITINALN